MRDLPAEFTSEELEEFLRADQLPEEADPEFKQRLREELWELVQELYAGERGDTGTRD